MLDYVPINVVVRVIRRPRYGCRSCEGAIVQAPAPERPISVGMATEALLAHPIVSKSISKDEASGASLRVTADRRRRQIARPRAMARSVTDVVAISSQRAPRRFTTPLDAVSPRPRPRDERRYHGRNA